MTSYHGWYGDPEIWAAVQLPPRGSLGVVICTPLGQEGVVAYRGLRLLADVLERRGIASVRYDPPGRGDAAPSDAPSAPMDGARAAAELLRRCGCTHIAFLGLSSAALIASEAATDNDLLVLWSAPASGRVWLRKNRSLATIELGPERIDGDIESLIGLDLTAEQAAALGAIRLRLPAAAATLIAARPGEPAPAGLDGAEVIEVPGTAEFLDTASMASVLPEEAVGLLVDWLARHDTDEAIALRPVALKDELRIGAAVERIRWVGPHELFAIDCAPVGADATTPVVLLHSGAAEHRVGAGDYQVELARLLAADGARSIRADRRRTGESSAVVPGEPPLLYSQEWLEDQEAILADLALPGDQVALTGLCAGGWVAGLSRSLTTRLTVIIHPLEYRTDPVAPGQYTDTTYAEQPGVKEDRKPLRQWYLDHAPMWLRRLRDRWMGRSGAAPFLAVSAAHAQRTVLIFSDLEQMIFERRGGPEAAHRLNGVEVVRFETADHALFSRHARKQVIAQIRREIDEAFELTPAD